LSQHLYIKDIQGSPLFRGSSPLRFQSIKVSVHYLEGLSDCTNFINPFARTYDFVGQYPRWDGTELVDGDVDIDTGSAKTGGPLCARAHVQVVHKVELQHCLEPCGDIAAGGRGDAMPGVLNHWHLAVLPQIITNPSCTVDTSV
jgi:hypothetical protein